MSAKPIAVRGGRLRKRGGQVVSFAPCFSDLMAGASRVALGGVLILSGIAALSPNSAMAMDVDQRCEGGVDTPNAIVCSGPADEDGLDEPEYISVADQDTTITTAEGFGIDVSNTDYFAAAISIYSGEDSDVSFTDANASTIVGNGTGLSVINNNGAISISTNGIIDGGNTLYGDADDARWSAGIAAVGGNGVSITVVEAGEVKANASSEYAPDIATGEDYLGEDSYSASASAAAVLAVQSGDADLSLTNDGGLTSSATVNSDVALIADSEVEYNYISTFARSTGALLDQQGVGALTVNNGGDITSTASANVSNVLRAPDGGGEDGTYSDDNEIDVALYAGGIITTHGGGVDTRDEPVDPINTALSITNDGDIEVAAVADGAIEFDAYYTGYNRVGAALHSNAVWATRDNGGDVEIANSSAISSTAAFNTDVSITSDSETYENFIGTLSQSTAVNATVEGDGNITVENDGDITSTASFGSDVSFGASEYFSDNAIGILNVSTGVFTDLSGDGEVLINNNANISSKASFDGSISFTSNDDIADSEAIVTLISTGASSIRSGEGDLTINNYGTINSEATFNSLSDGEVENEITGINFDADGDIGSSGAFVNLNSTAVDAKHFGAGDINILNASDGKIVSKAAMGSDIGVTADGTVSGGAFVMASATGLNAVHGGTGNIIAINDGSIEASTSLADALGGEDSFADTFERSVGVNLVHFGSGDIDLTTGGSITANDGIVAYHNGYGDISITATETSVIKADNDGIEAEIGDDDGEDSENRTILISNDGVITAGDDGIQVSLYRDGDITVTNTGTITASDDGIDVERYDDGNVTVTNSGTINAVDDGIYAYHDGEGELTVENSGKITADYYGVYAYHNGEGDITVENTGTIATGYYGIDTGHGGLGDINITNTGKITATADGEDGEDGVDYAYGIEAYHSGEGNISIVNDKTDTTTGAIAGSTAAIYAVTSDGAIEIVNNGTLANSSGESFDRAIIAGANSYDGSGSVAITNNGTLTGTIKTVGTGYFEGEDVDVSFADTIINNGTWNTAEGTNEFGAGEDSVTNGETGILRAANATFTGLDTLTNNGTLTLANGVGGDALNTDGDVVLNEGGNLVLDVSRNGSDTVYAGGDVTINGGKLTVNSVGQRLTQGTVTLIDATSITGEFDEDNVEDTVFLDLTLTKTEAVIDQNQQITLTVERTQEFAAVALTPNQNAVAAALESIEAPESFMPMARGVLPVGNEMLDEILYLPTVAAANDAYDQLSGEAHATLRSNLAEDSRLVRNSILTRLQNREGTAIWGEMFYGAGDLSQAKSRNTGNAERDAWGVIMGADTNVAENVTVGLAASIINHDNKQQSRDSKMDAETINLLAYVGLESGKARFKFGTGYAWTDVDTSRGVSFGRFSDKLVANYDASQFQAFAEVGYRLPLGGGYIEPMASIAYIDTTTDAFAEKGGLAALEGEKRSESTTVSNLGARFSTAKAGIFSINGMAGWQHSFGNLIPTNVMNFAGSDSFTVAGAAQSRDAAVAQLEAKFDVGETTSLSLGYDGMLGNAGDHHAVKASVRVKF